MKNEALTTRQQAYLKQMGTRTDEYQAYLESLTPQQRDRIQKHQANYKHGLWAIAPLTCLGIDKCPFQDKCPLGKNARYPLGLQCLLEGEYMAQRIAEYLVYLEVDPGNPIEISIINELALLDVIKNRALMVLSVGDREGDGRDLMRRTTIFDEEGNPVVTATIHPILDHLDRLERRREAWLRSLNETRKAKADLAFKSGNAQQNHRMIEEIENIRKAIETMETKQLTMEDPIKLD